jgi:hypothetical protein
MPLLATRYALTVLTGLPLRTFAIMGASALLTGDALAGLTTLVFGAVLVTLAAGNPNTAIILACFTVWTMPIRRTGNAAPLITDRRTAGAILIAFASTGGRLAAVVDTALAIRAMSLSGAGHAAIT